MRFAAPRLEGKDQRITCWEIAEDVARELVDTYCLREQHPGQWNTAQLLAEVNSQFGIDAKAAGADPAALKPRRIGGGVGGSGEDALRGEGKAVQPGPAALAEGESFLMWWIRSGKTNLLSLDHLKEGIGLRGYGQKDPLVEFQEGSVHSVRRHDGADRQRNDSVFVSRADPARGSAAASVEGTSTGAAASSPAECDRSGRQPLRHVLKSLRRRNCRILRGRWKSGRNASRKTCSFKRGPRKRRHQSRCVLVRKSDEMILVLRLRQEVQEVATGREAVASDRRPASDGQ